MNSESPSPHVPRLSRVFRWSGILLAVLLVLLAILAALLPAISNMAIVYWLEKQGVQADIQRIEIDLNDAVVTIVDARGQNEQGRGFSLERFHIDLAWQPLTERTLRIENIEVSGLDLDSLQDAEGLQSIAGLVLSELAGSDTPEDVRPDATTAKPWRMELNLVDLKDIHLCHELSEQDLRYCLKLDALNWTGEVAYDAQQSVDHPLMAEGDMALGPAGFEETRQAVEILSLGALELDGLSMQGVDNIRLENTRLEKLMLFPGRSSLDAGPVARLDSLQLEQVLLENRLLSIRQVTLSGIGASLYRDEAGQLEISRIIDMIRPEVSAADTTAVAQTTEQSQPLPVRIASLVVQDSHPVIFVDKSLSTPFDMKATIRVLSVQNIDTAQPDQSSELKIDVVTDNHGSIELNGSIQLMTPTRSFDISGEVKGVDLRPAGAYIESGLGHRIRSGQLNARLTLKASEGQLDSSLDLDLKHFDLRKTPGEAESIDKDLGIPLGTALNLLRDRDNSIRLTVPVTGDVASPEFDPSDAIRKATSKAITSAVISYYTPFGLVTVVEGLYNLATAIRIQPVVFAPGSAELTADHRDQLDKLAKLMTERPEVYFSLCGFSNGDDARARVPERARVLEQPDTRLGDQGVAEMTGFADQRAEAVKTYMVEQGIGGDRLILCEGEFHRQGLAGVKIDI